MKVCDLHYPGSQLRVKDNGFLKEIPLAIRSIIMNYERAVVADVVETWDHLWTFTILILWKRWVRHWWPFQTHVQGLSELFHWNSIPFVQWSRRGCTLLNRVRSTCKTGRMWTALGRSLLCGGNISYKKDVLEMGLNVQFPYREEPCSLLRRVIRWCALDARVHCHILLSML